MTLSQSFSRVAIIGAGVAGLAAYNEFQKSGIEATIFEKGISLGGKASSFEIDGVISQVGGQRSFSAKGEYLALIRSLYPKHSSLFYPVKIHGFQNVSNLRDYFCGFGRGELGLYRLTQLKHLYLKESMDRFDDRSILSHACLYYGERMGSILSRKWASWFCLDGKQTSRAIALEHLCKGVDSLYVPQVALEKSESTLPVRLDSHIKSIDLSHGKISLKADADELTHFDAIVLATPPHVAARLSESISSNAEKSLLLGVRYEASAALHILLRSPFFGRSFESFPESNVEANLGRVSVESAESSRVPEGFELCVALATPDFLRRFATKDVSSLRLVMESEVNRLFPGLMRKIVGTKLFCFKEGVPAFPVGHLERMVRLLEITKKEIHRGRPLAYAGDYLTSPTLDGAAKSGRIAARVLIEG